MDVKNNQQLLHRGSVPFGRRDGRMWDVDEVDNGLACRCVCPVCHESLVARHGQERIHHFAHHAKARCKGAYDASIWQMAAEIVREAGFVRAPGLTVEAKAWDSRGNLIVETETLEDPRELHLADMRAQAYRFGRGGTIKGLEQGSRYYVEIMLGGTQIKKLQASPTAKQRTDPTLVVIVPRGDERVLKRRTLAQFLLESEENRVWWNYPNRAAIQRQVEQRLARRTQPTPSPQPRDERASRPTESWKASFLRSKARIESSPSGLKEGRPIRCGHCGHQWRLHRLELSLWQSNVMCPQCKRCVPLGARSGRS